MTERTDGQVAETRCVGKEQNYDHQDRTRKQCGSRSSISPSQAMVQWYASLPLAKLQGLERTKRVRKRARLLARTATCEK